MAWLIMLAMMVKTTTATVRQMRLMYTVKRSAGAEGTAETPSNPGLSCSNGTDDDGDGWIDKDDPSCEKTNGGSESGDIDVEHWGSPTCFNGVDDNGDALVDAEDPACVNWYDNE